MAYTNKKAQEMEIRTIMQGLEEFASFMSFSGNNGDMRIISVETVDRAAPAYQTVEPSSSAKVHALHQHQHKSKSLSFSDRTVH